MKKILFLALFLSSVLFSVSCERDGAIYDFPKECALVSFPSTTATVEMLKEDGNKFSVELWRGNTAGNVSIPVTVKYDVEGVFTAAKQSFDFADGEAIATMEFSYADINAFGGESYSIEITVSDENQVSPTGNQSVKVSASRKLTPVFVCKGTFYSDFYEEAWSQELYNTVEAPNYYILPDCWVKGVDFSFTVENGTPVFPSMWDSGYTYGSYGNVYIYQTGVTYADGVITIAAGYALPAISYDFGSGYTESFTLPAGVTL